MSSKVLVVGCGGIGGVIAARLVRAGVDVTAVTGNDEVAAALRSGGFRVKEFEGDEWTVAAGRVVKTAAELPAGARFDVCIVATKATTLQAAVRDVVPWLADEAPVVVCQNGLPEELAAGVVGARRVLGCVVVWGATMGPAGAYTRTSRGGFQLGRLVADGPDPRAVAALLEPAGAVTLVDDLAAVRWSKMAINCATSTLGAIGGKRLGPLLRRRFVRRLVLELWTEFVAVARAANVKLAPVGGTLDIEKMALTAAERSMTLGSPKLAVKHSILVAVGMKYRRLRSSMLVAIERGRVPEIDFLNGEIVARGRQLGVPTPVNARLVEAVRHVASGRVTPSLDLLRTVYDDVMDRGAGASSSLAA